MSLPSRRDFLARTSLAALGDPAERPQQHRVPQGLGLVALHRDAERLVRSVKPLQQRLAEPEVTIVAETLVALGCVAHDFPRVAEIDVNPLVIRDGTGVALDGLIVLSD